MASLVKFCKISNKLLPKNGVYMYNIVRNSMIRDFKPGPYPKTEEEIAKAAEKYGLLQEDYKPIPDDDGCGMGDYPDLPLIGAESKDEYYPWDYPNLKRNFNEPLHIHFNAISEDRWNPTAELRYPMYVYWLTFLGIIGGFATLYCVCDNYRVVQPRMPKQYHGDGRPHYTFEPPH